MTAAVIISIISILAIAVIMYVFSQRTSRLLAQAQEQTRSMYQREVEASVRQQREAYELQNARLLAEVKALSSQLVAEQSKNLRENNRLEINGIVDPLRRQIENFEQIIHNSREKDASDRASLMTQINHLMELNKNIGNEARQLTNALKGDSKVQGDWGEAQLNTLLEQGGLMPGVHFTVQATRDSAGRTLHDEQGNLRRPDVLIFLPDDRRLVVDSKVSLTAFADYSAAVDEEQKKIFARKHLASVKKHIKELADKNYPGLVEGACDQSLMFMPLEGAFMLAVHLDPGILRYAAELHVAIVTPTHLFSLVQLAAQLWRQDARDRNTQRIAEMGGRLYDKLALFLNNFDKIGDTLDKARNTWSDARAQLATGRGNALRTAEQLRDMGAKVTRRLPVADTGAADEDA